VAGGRHKYENHGVQAVSNRTGGDLRTYDDGHGIPCIGTEGTNIVRNGEHIRGGRRKMETKSGTPRQSSDKDAIGDAMPSRST
jgi:hypothetical protein